MLKLKNYGRSPGSSQLNFAHYRGYLSYRQRCHRLHGDNPAIDGVSSVDLASSGR